MLKPKKEPYINMLSYEGDQFDALIVFGYGPVAPSGIPGSGKLPLYGRINALAAGLLYKSCNIGILIPTGGKTGGIDKPSEADLIAQYLKSRFGISESVFILEDQATNTILNVVNVANIVDKLLYQNKRLAFLAMGFHIQRIQEICSLIGLQGFYFSAETIVSMRSSHHKKLLIDLLTPVNSNYANVLADQERWHRGLIEIPEYWLPQASMVENSTRLRKILQTDRIQAFLHSAGITDIDSYPIEDLRTWLKSIPRKLP